MKSCFLLTWGLPTTVFLNKNWTNCIEYFSSVNIGRSMLGFVLPGWQSPEVSVAIVCFTMTWNARLTCKPRGHPALSLLIPDSSFSLDSTTFSSQTGPADIIRQGWITRRMDISTHAYKQWNGTLILFLGFFVLSPQNRSACSSANSG